MAGFARFVRLVRVLVEHLKLGLHEDHAAERPRGGGRAFEHGVRKADRHIHHEVHDFVSSRRESIVEGAETVFEVSVELQLGREDAEVGVGVAIAAKMETGVGGLSRHHVVEGEDVAHQKTEHWEHVVELSGDDSKPQLVVDLCGVCFGFGKQLAVQGVFVFPAADELHNREPAGQRVADYPIDFLLDEVKYLLIGCGQHEQQLSRLEVMNDVHHFQDGAGTELAMAFA